MIINMFINILLLTFLLIKYTLINYKHCMYMCIFENHQNPIPIIYLTLYNFCKLIRNLSFAITCT